MGILITIYNSLFGKAVYGTDRYGKLERESDTETTFDKRIKRIFYKDSINNSIFKSVRKIFYK